MLKSKIIRVEKGYSQKNNKDFYVAWYTADDGLPCRDYCPDWVQTGMDVIIKIIPDKYCNGRVTFEKV